ncbi:DUF2490 domain-containing protein [Dyadobacter sediminis]|uniref:DUF2490 domain-containing protein n=1 Tax=Dyadobacter sediminis TaxID=1493691 RepID=A0A5R9KKA0_9BACT|nr:DUF2490 domain-containing protein [Dyadobacter sediminis]TLU96643.1 DUF2490 domain-containing protein [Dyadobacter sediminis]GGB83981.1 hypothetical protein GCM10011325_09440 [Dyadobacter sediminis]
MYKSFLAVFLLIFAPAAVFSQAVYRAGTLPQFNLNIRISDNLKLNNKLESRQIFSEREEEQQTRNRFRYERADLTMVLTRKLSAANTLGGGYLIRLEEGRFAHRLIQQFNNVTNHEYARIAHRIVTDETFRRDSSVQVRLRYRIGFEKALNGINIDPKEFYAKLNNEYLGIYEDKSADLEIRALLALGYNATDNNRIEMGFEYRVNEFNKSVQSQQYWLAVSWFISI